MPGPAPSLAGPERRCSPPLETCSSAGARISAPRVPRLIHQRPLSVLHSKYVQSRAVLSPPLPPLKPKRSESPDRAWRRPPRPGPRVHPGALYVYRQQSPNRVVIHCSLECVSSRSPLAASCVTQTKSRMTCGGRPLAAGLPCPAWSAPAPARSTPALPRPQQV